MNYKGHAIERQGDRFVVQPYGHDFASVGEAQAWVDGHVDRESKKSARPGSVLDLVKGTAGHRIAFESALAKAGQPKAPSGYSPVPGGMHGGFRKKVGAKWRYWYPSTEAAEAAGSHHRAEAKKNARDTRSPYYSNESSKPWAIEMDRKRREHSEHAEGAQDFINREVSKEREKERKKRDAEGAKKREGVSAEGAPAGMHRVATRDGYDEVSTEARHGLYSVHKHPTPWAKKKTGYTVTHTPSGMAAGNFPTKKEAVDAAKHFHDHAGDAGSDTRFGEEPRDEDVARIRSAARALFSTRKSETAADYAGAVYRIGSVTYHEAPRYQSPAGGDVARPGMSRADLANPPVLDDGRDPIIPELARLNGQLVDPRHGILAMVRRNGG
jgi:hypothetical protein